MDLSIFLVLYWRTFKVGQKEIIVEDYNDHWKSNFDELRGIFSSQLKDMALTIEHVGSTSVPGLAAKPILDIDIVIDSMGLLPKVIEELNKLGYYHEGNLGVEGREAFARIDEYVPYTVVEKIKQEHHLYVCNKGCKELKNHVNFRDILIKHPHLVESYTRLKRELAQEFRENRLAYTNGKSDFVNDVLKNYI